jgi:hypothetical protein
MAKTKIGSVKMRPTANRRVKSRSWGSGSVEAKRGFLSSAMPHFGQTPGESLSMPAHIGQKYFATGVGGGFSASAPWQQQGLLFKGG